MTCAATLYPGRQLPKCDGGMPAGARGNARRSPARFGHRRRGSLPSLPVSGRGAGRRPVGGVGHSPARVHGSAVAATVATDGAPGWRGGGRAPMVRLCCPRSGCVLPHVRCSVADEQWTGLGAVRVLLDTNIVIHREAASVVREDIGVLFRWLDKLGHEKCVHPHTIDEIAKHGDPKVVRSFGAKLKSYSVLVGVSADPPEIAKVRLTDLTSNDVIDTDILRELVIGRVDLLITEDRGLHSKAARLGVIDHVFSIDQFLEKANAENPEQLDYKVLSVRKEFFARLSFESEFFDSFKGRLSRL